MIVMRHELILNELQARNLERISKTQPVVVVHMTTTENTMRPFVALCYQYQRLTVRS